MALPTRSELHFPASQSQQIDPYIPHLPPAAHHHRPNVTLTFATSIDSNLALAPGTRTALSGPESKAMTHYLRSKHDAIIVGVGTAIADNPSLNCRMTGAGGYGGKELENQPRPIILDPRGRWNVTPESKMIALAREGKGKAPWIFTCFTEESYDEKRRDLVEKFGGQIFVLDPMWIDDEPRLSWHDVFRALKNEGINSVMVEGGASVVNQLLSPMYFNNLVDTVIVTIAPTWLGKGGVQVCPEAKYIRGSEAKSKVKVPVARLKAVKWIPLGEDVVLCGHPRSYEEDAPVVENNDVIEE